MTVHPDCVSKTELRKRLSRSELVTVVDTAVPGVKFENGTVEVHGPHLVRGRRWTAVVVVEDGRVIKVK